MERLLKVIGNILLVFVLLPGFSQKIVTLTVDGAINSVVADYIKEGIHKATNEKAACLIINLNTPGGLLKSTRVIVGEMLDAKIPVVVFVSPSGSHAGSAGVFITMAAHVAAMAPGTNIGSAHPVGLQGSMDSILSQKTTNDAAAFIRSIAEDRGRNANWGEEAVRYSVALAETEALKKNVVDLIAENEQDLLRQLHGWVVKMEDDERVLNTQHATTEPYNMNWIQKLLNYISDPNISYILLLLGIYGLIFEFYNPGIGLPGVVGGISLLLAFYAMNSLPINITGLALIVLGIVLFILEINTPTNGILGIGAVVSLFLGSIMLIKPGADFEWAKISLHVIIPAVALTALFFLVILAYGLRAQKNKVSTGVEGLVGEIGKSLTELNPTGNVFIQGEIWRAKTESGFIAKEKSVKVKSISGLELTVEEET